MKLTLEKNDSSLKYKESEEHKLKLEEEKQFISTQLKEAKEKIVLLDSENVKLQEENKLKEKNVNGTSTQTTKTDDKKMPRELRQLQMQNNVLHARLRQSECGINKKNIRKREREMRKKRILKSKRYWSIKCAKGNIFFIRWKGFEHRLRTTLFYPLPNAGTICSVEFLN